MGHPAITSVPIFSQRFKPINKAYVLYKCPDQCHFQFVHYQMPLPMYLNRISIRSSNCLPRHVYWHPTLSRVWRSATESELYWVLAPFGPYFSLLSSFCNAVSLSITPIALSARCKLFAAECKSSPQCGSKQRSAP